jgi:N-dimethylarginine dimethylaminohydrolase
MQQLTTTTKIEPQKGPGFRGKATLVENIDLSGMKVKCDSEDGQLKKVVVHPPDYLTWDSKTAINQVERNNSPPPTGIVKKEHEMLVNALVTEGVEVIMTKPRTELPEAVYQRDSIGVIGETAFSANFKHPVRQKELSIIDGAWMAWKTRDIIEFGDVLVFPDAVLVGLGDRTNKYAVQTLRQVISGKEIIGVPLVDGSLHLDYATTIGGRGKMRTMVACPELYEYPRMINPLITRLDIQNIITVPFEKQDKGWTNLLFVNPETVISTTSAKEVNAQLRKIGFKVIDIPFDGILTGEGAPRCCTAPILRED